MCLFLTTTISRYYKTPSRCHPIPAPRRPAPVDRVAVAHRALFPLRVHLAAISSLAVLSRNVIGRLPDILALKHVSRILRYYWDVLKVSTVFVRFVGVASPPVQCSNTVDIGYSVSL